MPTSGTRKASSLLLVDDDEGDRMLVQKILKTHNPSLDIDAAEDGEEAISFLLRRGRYQNSRQPDLVLLDLNLPKRDGYEVLRAIREDPLISSLPVVIFTTSMAPGDIRKCYELHANAFVSKPSDLDLLRACLQSIHDFWLRLAGLPSR